jgi:hypothetical protein
MKNSTKIVLVALAAIVLVSTVAVLTLRGTHVLAASYAIPPTALRTPWSATCTPQTAGPGYSQCTITAPANAALVIQTISAFNMHAHNTRVMLVVVTMGGNTPMPWYITTAPVHTSPGFYTYCWSELVTLYADPGSTITVSAYHENNPPYLPQITLAGYFVAPS